MIEDMPQSFTYQSMGTTWKISLWDTLDTSTFAKLEREIIARSELFDQTFSRFKPDSFVSSLAEKTGRLEVPEHFVSILTLYKLLYDASNKKLNPLIGYTISDLGYDSTYSLVEKDIVRKVPDLTHSVRIIDDSHVEVKEPVLFDFGALGKGYFVDRIADYLRERAVKRFLVDGSGDIYYEGAGIPIEAGLEDPTDSTKVIGSLTLERGGFCGSAGNRRAWEGRHHIIDPETLLSPTELSAVWVEAKSAAVADALATCLFFVPPEQIPAEFSFEFCLLNNERRVKHSPQFAARFF